MKIYKAVYFYSNDNDGQLYQGWGSDGPFQIPEGELTLETLDNIQKHICDIYHFDQCMIVNMIEVDG